MPQLTSFTCFPQLPVELRLLVWEQYALPKAPIIYAGSYRPPLYGGPTTLADYTRNIIRVNREARMAVLGHREICDLAAGQIYFEGLRFHQGRAEHILYGIFYRFMLVNWERDAFSLSIKQLKSLLYQSYQLPGFLMRIQNLVIRPETFVFDDWFPSKFIHYICHYLFSVRDITFVFDDLEFEEACFRNRVPSSIPLMKIYNHKRLKGSTPCAKEFEFGFIPFPTRDDLILGYGHGPHDPKGYTIAEKWHWDKLTNWADNLVKTIKEGIAARSGIRVGVRLAVYSAIRDPTYLINSAVYEGM